MTKSEQMKNWWAHRFDPKPVPRTTWDRKRKSYQIGTDPKVCVWWRVNGVNGVNREFDCPECGRLLTLPEVSIVRSCACGEKIGISVRGPVRLHHSLD